MLDGIRVQQWGTCALGRQAEMRQQSGGLWTCLLGGNFLAFIMAVSAPQAQLAHPNLSPVISFLLWILASPIPVSVPFLSVFSRPPICCSLLLGEKYPLFLRTDGNGSRSKAVRCLDISLHPTPHLCAIAHFHCQKFERISLTLSPRLLCARVKLLIGVVSCGECEGRFLPDLFSLSPVHTPFQWKECRSFSFVTVGCSGSS